MKKTFPPGTPIISNLTASLLLEKPEIFNGAFACVKCVWEGNGSQMKRIKMLTNYDKITKIDMLVCPSCMSKTFFQLDNYEYSAEKIGNPMTYVLGVVGLVIILIILVVIAYIFL